MTRRFRADGIAAALLPLVATTAFAAPSVVTRAGAVSPLVLADHVSPTVADHRKIDAFADVHTGFARPRAPRGAAGITRGIGHAAGNSVQARRSIRRLVRARMTSNVANAERECLAGAVYFEAQSEPIEGQLAVAEVVLNRAASGEYPSSICKVVTQPAQFSFILDGRFPAIDRSSEAWRKAVAVADIAAENLADTLPSDVLWYHADYVAPSWGRRLHRLTQIGAHIFYRRR